jgi:ATPase subunit of ABC transporter with duplicated ATPase domains
VPSPSVAPLDEPTNHLDAESVAWLERTLTSYDGCVVAVTHDRYFLDNAAGWILELDKGAGIPYEGNYSSWLDQKRKRLADEEKQESARQRTLARELEWVQASPRARQAKSKARIESYERLLAEEPERRERELEISIPPGPRLGDVVINADKLRKGYGDRLLFDDLTFALPRGGIVGIIGPNGAGKTTLFRLITGEEKADGGSLVVGETVKLGYVSQSRDALDPKKNVWEEIAEGQENIQIGTRTRNARAYVASFNFRGPDQQKRVGDLSGGERNRVAPRRAVERSRRRHAARARGGAPRLRGLRGRDQPRPLVPRPRRDAPARLRGRQSRALVRGELPLLRGVHAQGAWRRLAAASHQVSPADARVVALGGARLRLVRIDPEIRDRLRDVLR